MRRHHKRASAVGRLMGCLAAGALVLAVAGCTSDDEADDGAIDVTLAEWKVDLSKADVAAGKVTLNASNEGTVEHELVIVKTDDAPDALPVEDGRVPEDAVDVVDEIKEFPAGETASGAFDLAAGKYVLFCNLPAHYEQGMRAGLTVE